MRGEERRESEGPRVFFPPLLADPPRAFDVTVLFPFFFFLALLLFSLSLPPLPQRRRKTTRLRARGEGRHCPSLHASAVAWRDEGAQTRKQRRRKEKRCSIGICSLLGPRLMPRPLRRALRGRRVLLLRLPRFAGSATVTHRAPHSHEKSAPPRCG